MEPFSLNSALGMLLRLLLATLAVILIDGVEALFIRRLTPQKWYLPERRAFNVGKKEFSFYKRIGVKKWKDKIPELGVFTGFSKRKLGDTSSLPYLKRFLIESNYGVVIHIVNAHTGFLVIFVPYCDSAAVWLPVFAINYLLSMAPVCVLRYTSHFLKKIYVMKVKQETKIKAADPR